MTLLNNNKKQSPESYSIVESEKELKIIIDKSEPKGSYIVFFCFMLFFITFFISLFILGFFIGALIPLIFFIIFATITFLTYKFKRNYKVEWIFDRVQNKIEKIKILPKFKHKKSIKFSDIESITVSEYQWKRFPPYFHYVSILLINHKKFKLYTDQREINCLNLGSIVAECVQKPLILHNYYRGFLIYIGLIVSFFGGLFLFFLIINLSTSEISFVLILLLFAVIAFLILFVLEIKYSREENKKYIEELKKGIN